MRSVRWLALVSCVLGLPEPSRADIAGKPSPVHALVGAEVVVRPGASPEAMTIVLRDGRIESVGADVRVPAGARTYDLRGRVVYAGFFEPYARLDDDEIEAEMRTGSVHPNPYVRAEARVVDQLPLDDKRLTKLRKAGFTHGYVSNGAGVFRGRGAVIGFVDDDMASHVALADAAHSGAFQRAGWRSTIVPGSLMGSIALTRQTLLDAGWYRDAVSAAERAPARVTTPPANRSLAALGSLIDGEQPWVIESEDLAMFERVARVAREFELRPIVVSGGSDEYRDPRWLADTLDEIDGRLVLTLNTPPPPYWAYDDQRWGIELDALRHWEVAASSPALVAEAGVAFAFSTQGLSSPDKLFERVREAVDRGLSPTKALAALTTVPADLYGLGDRFGVVAPGRSASLTVLSDELFDPSARVVEVWIDGRRFADAPDRARTSDVTGRWEFVTDRTLGAVKLSLEDDALSGQVAADDDSTALGDVALRRGVLTFDSPWGAFEGRVHDDLVYGAFSQNGVSDDAWGRRVDTKPDDDEDEDDALLSLDADGWPPVAANETVSVWVRGATIWSQADAGTFVGDLWVEDGVIRAVGDVGSPSAAVEIDGTGRHVTPGLIDAHSHSAISGGVNEGTESATCEVRIADVLNPRSVALYRELAGGLTVANMLHGSANAIGGQNAVIKHRWGARADDLVFDGAPAGVKFALGENVKQSNWGDDYTTRYPQTRMGVEQFFRDRFLAAVDYRDARSKGTDPRTGWPVRRDLELDAIVDIIEGRRLIHCHSYRQDEILALIRVMDEFGVRIGTFQHVLEGYKVADEIAAHGAGASCFSDWWAYKYEVIDAIPYAGRLMWERGVLTSFNSDSRDLARRMNLEAAKAVKYGGVPEDEALKFVTLNPAKQLGIDEWVGSLEPGKHGDFVIWSDHPLSDRAICLQTWIDGVKRFDREADLAARAGALSLREALLDKAEEAHGGKPPKRFEATFGARHGSFEGDDVVVGDERGACGGCGLDGACEGSEG